jgi:carboxypeptidase C (cathepsin A)
MKISLPPTLVLLLSTLLALPFAAHGQADDAPPPPTKEEVAPAASITRHSVRIDGVQVQYEATVGWLIMRDEDAKPIARFGYTAYTRQGVDDPSRRPIMFAFNGGPGSSSIWLHMGILGPRRIVVNDGGFAPPPPADVVDNAYSIIDVTDLVMIDPVGTGFSKPLGETEGEAFWGVDQDIRSVAAFIKQYVSENGRWGSPKYLLGESYGGIRSTGLVWHLQSVHNMAMNGLVLVSPFLNMGSGIDGAHIDKPHVLYLAALAATAWYHDKLTDKPESLEDFVAEVERFAYEQYAPALLAGYTLEPERKQALATALARYTGLRADYWLAADLRVSHQQFVQELMRDDRRIAGRIDSRFSGPSVNPLAEAMDYDPFFPAIGPAFTAGFLSYLHGELEFGRDETYAVSAFGIDWDWSHTPPNGGGWAIPWADTRPDLAMALTTNPGLHVLVQQGYYDLATPVTATRHDIAHLDIPAEARERIRMAYYEAGHMMYVHQPSMRQFREDLANFVRDSDRL